MRICRGPDLCVYRIAAVTYTTVGLLEDDLVGCLLAVAAVGVGRAVHIMGFESEQLEARIDLLRDEQEQRALEGDDRGGLPS